MLTEVKLFLGLLVLAGALWGGSWVRGMHAENKRLGAAVQTLTGELEAAQKLRKLDQAVASRHAQRVATMTTIQKATDAKLQAALAGNAPWADETVPPDVARALGLQLPAAP